MQAHRHGNKETRLDNTMTIGFDYWQCVSHYPDEFSEMWGAFENYICDVHIISAIGKTRIGTIADDVRSHKQFERMPDSRIHEVVFKKSRESPELKLAKCKELGITMFFDDRQDVCDLLNANGILAFKVPRKDDSTDIEGERK